MSLGRFVSLGASDKKFGHLNLVHDLLYEIVSDQSPDEGENMKKLVFLAVVSLLGAGAFASDAPAEKDVVVNINDVFVPPGFDSNSNIVVVASGIFPNSCYKWKEARVTHDKAKNLHEVRSTAAVSQGMCLMVLVPFQKDIDLGVLGRGDHTVRFMSGDGTYLEKSIKIE